MEIILIVLAFAIELMVSAGFLWIGMKFAAVYAGMPNGGVYCSYSALFKVCFFAALVSIIPAIGWILSWVVLFVLLKKETEAEASELIIMVLVSKVASLLAAIFVFPAIALSF